MKKKSKMIVSAIAVLAMLIVGGVLFGNMILGWFHEGNGKQYDVSNVPVSQNDILKDKKILFLGSSVTRGFASNGVSFVDYIAQSDNCVSIKEAVSGTTLVDNGKNSYVQRLQTNVDTNEKIDLLVCQLSTNDAAKDLPLGSISEGLLLSDFDTKTVCGAIEYIIAYAKKTWDCDVVFYTGTRYDSEEYDKMVEKLLEIQEKWSIGVIDQWNDVQFNNITNEERALYMKDDVHPTRAGYLLWWTPNIQQYLYEYCEENDKE